MIFRYEENTNSVSTINGTLGWPTHEAENDQFTEPLSAVSQLVRQPSWLEPVVSGGPLVGG
jgi:hypothetical protein